MITQLSFRRPVTCSAWTAISRFVGDPARWLPPPAQPVEDQWLVAVHAGPLSWTVCVTVDDAHMPPEGYVRRLRWVPRARPGHAAHHPLPELEGRLILREEPHETPTLGFQGHYRAPGGPLGATLDVAGMHRVAEVTVRRVVGEIAERLGAPQREAVGG